MWCARHMRSVILLAGLTAIGACARESGDNAAAANQAAPTANAIDQASNVAAPAASASATLPAGFPGAEIAVRGAECVVYLGLSAQANARPGGYDAAIMERAARQWQAAIRIEGRMSETEVRQLVGSSVNPLMSTPPAQRDAASAWCVQNAPAPDPER